MGDVPNGTVYIWKYPCSITFQRYVSHLQSSYHHRAWNQVERGALQGICWLEWFDFDVVQSTSEMWINPGLHLLVKWRILLKVVCGLKWMPCIAWFWVHAMLVVQFSCFAILFPPNSFHSNYLSMSLCHGWIRGTGEIRLLRVYRFFIGSIFRWLCTWYVVDELIINQHLVDGYSGAPTVFKLWWLRMIPAGRW